MEKEKIALYVGPSHAADGIPVKIDNHQNVEVEGMEFLVCQEAYMSDEPLSYKGKTNLEVLSDIHKRFKCDFNQPHANSSDFIICKLAVRDLKMYDRSGTVRQILDAIQGDKGCKLSNGQLGVAKVMAAGGKLSLFEVKRPWEIPSEQYRNFIEDNKNRSSSLMKITPENIQSASDMQLYHLINLIHPDQKGYNVSRGEVIEEYDRRGGMEMSIRIGLPVDPNYPYYNRYSEGIESLQNILRENEPNRSIQDSHWWFNLHEDWLPVLDFDKELERLKAEYDATLLLKPKKGEVGYSLRYKQNSLLGQIKIIEDYLATQTPEKILAQEIAVIENAIEFLEGKDRAELSEYMQTLQDAAGFLVPKKEKQLPESKLNPEIVLILDKLRKGKFSTISEKEIDLLDDAINFSIAFRHHTMYKDAHANIGGLTKVGVRQWLEAMKEDLLLRTFEIMPEYLTEKEKQHYAELGKLRSKKNNDKKQIEHQFLRDYGAKFGEMPTRYIKYNEQWDELEIYPSGETKSDGEELSRSEYTNDGLLDYVHAIAVKDKKKLNPRSVEILQRDNAQIIGFSNVENLVSIMNSKYKNQGYSLKQLYDETIYMLGSKDGALIFSEFIKRKKDENDVDAIDEFNKTAFVEDIKQKYKELNEEQDAIEALTDEFGGRFIFSKNTDGRFEVMVQEQSGPRELNIRGVKDIRELRTKVKSWIRQNPEDKLPVVAFVTVNTAAGSCVIYNIAEAISSGRCDNHLLSAHEINQLKDIESGESTTFVSSKDLPFPKNLIALLTPTGNSLLLPTTVRFTAAEYAAIKRELLKAGGKYVKNSFVFEEDALDVYNRILSGEEYALKKKYQFFATSSELSDYAVELAQISCKMKLFEPSAGDGALISAIHRVCPENRVDYCEIMPQNQKKLRQMKMVNECAADFTTYHPGPIYDRVIANPPFSKNQDIDHIRQMYDCLVPGGRLVSFSSMHWQLAADRKSKEFKDWLSTLDAQVIEIPAGKFKHSGTMIATLIIVINKPLSNTIYPNKPYGLPEYIYYDGFIWAKELNGDYYHIGTQTKRLGEHLPAKKVIELLKENKAQIRHG